MRDRRERLDEVAGGTPDVDPRYSAAATRSVTSGSAGTLT